MGQVVETAGRTRLTYVYYNLTNIATSKIVLTAC